MSSNVFLVLLMCSMVDSQTWLEFHNFQYSIEMTPVISYAEAEMECSALQANVANVKTTAIFDFLKLHINVTDVPYCFYIGAMRIASTGSFRWNDGSDVTTTQWHTGEPNNYLENENCTTMGDANNFRSSFPWFDVPCTYYARYICEKLIPTTTTMSTTSSTKASTTTRTTISTTIISKTKTTPSITTTTTPTTSTIKIKPTKKTTIHTSAGTTIVTESTIPANKTTQSTTVGVTTPFRTSQSSSATSTSTPTSTSPAGAKQNDSNMIIIIASSGGLLLVIICIVIVCVTSRKCRSSKQAPAVSLSGLRDYDVVDDNYQSEETYSIPKADLSSFAKPSVPNDDDSVHYEPAPRGNFYDETPDDSHAYSDVRKLSQSTKTRNNDHQSHVPEATYSLECSTAQQNETDMEAYDQLAHDKLPSEAYDTVKRSHNEVDVSYDQLGHAEISPAGTYDTAQPPASNSVEYDQLGRVDIHTQAHDTLENSAMISNMYSQLNKTKNIEDNTYDTTSHVK